MKTRIAFWLITVLSILVMVNCKKKDNNTTNETGWNLSVKTPTGDTIAIATGNFTITATAFIAHIKTSRIGGGNIVKEFDMSGQMAGDSLLVNNLVLNLTDPVENVTVNGRVHVANNLMNGTGTYSIVQPPDTIPYNGNFVVTALKQ